jgi:large subunit ribosomal protein L9
LPKLKDDAAKKAASFESVTLTIPMKAEKAESFSDQLLHKTLQMFSKKWDMLLTKKQITLKEDHIKTLGNYTAEVALHKDVKVTVNFEVVEA